MEKKHERKRASRKRKSKPQTFSYHDRSLHLHPQLRHVDADTIFALLLAGISNSHRPDSLSLIEKCLIKLPHSLLSTKPNHILSLLPFLLCSKRASITSRGAEIVGMASLFSLEMNERIAFDADIVKGLVSALASSKRSVLMAACNAVLDMSTTSVARERLLASSALESLMFGFLQVPKSPVMQVSLCTVDDGNATCLKIGFEEDELPILLLTASVILINSCSMEQLEKIPTNLSETFLVLLKKLWAKVHNQMLLANTMRSIQEAHIYISNIRTDNIAESIFRLSINSSQVTAALPFEVVKRSIFGLDSSSFEDFMLNHWEVSPFRISRALDVRDDVFSSFIRSLHSAETVPSFLSLILQNSVSCFPISSDELGILSFLEEVRNKLGCPIIYQQDIRVLRTESQLKREVHFFKESLNSCYKNGSHFFNIDDVLKCEEAYQEGYTVALRGMEFRFESIAAIANGVASIFGQPSVGVNMYLTPPNSQGLARHFDDHCVFVCQLFGTKKWTVFSQPNALLPRLYDPLDSLPGAEAEVSVAECREILLKEGDILYIPRGFPHEACTDSGCSNGSAGFSLHLTLGIEVEPPFEWEGFAHVALCCWSQTQKQPQFSLLESAVLLDVISVNVLHVAIGLVGDSDPTFRKACLVAAISLSSDTGCWLDLHQRTIFSHLIDKVNTESRFLEALRSIEVAIQKTEDPFHQIRWLRLLNMEGESIEGNDWNVPFVEMAKVFPLCVMNKDQVEAAFMRVKSRFCHEVLFGDVVDSYKMLLDKYRMARKQYLNGMVSLHCTS
ncbi:uncharacterized protein LOC121263777 [Juglans microcarpa x Juglans regia]|uniref:uncharacterized protein LOC121263777 n=1 Tax=Juglans microcarpa x Juglans regia TaxID=2249226 RepID=UPI001B7E4C79|nr:uncharacterized protein LOC121263777 [Juglans microcarpa x Juglans regia]